MFPENPEMNERTVSEKQLEANRRNALKSTGPRTAAGKSRSALNALRHGLTAQITVMTGAQREAHDKFFHEFAAGLQPVGAVEINFAESAAEDAWRLNRIRALEENIYALGHPELDADANREGDPNADSDPELALALGHARTFMANPKNFQMLMLYEQRLNRSMQKNLQLLREIQTERKAAYDKAFEEAQLLAQLAYHEGKAYDPDDDFPIENGFVFSISEINAAIDRGRRLKQARQHSKGNWSPAIVHRPKAA